MCVQVDKFKVVHTVCMSTCLKQRERKLEWIQDIL